MGLGPVQTVSQNFHTQPTPYYNKLRIGIPEMNFEPEVPEYEVVVPNI
jgi:hypothetical protein